MNLFLRGRTFASLFALGSFAVVGCSSTDDASTPPPLEVTGTVGGITVPSVDSAGVIATFEPNTAGVNATSEPLTLMLVAVADKSNLCGYRSSPPSTTALSFILGVKGRAISPGTYNVGAVDLNDAGTATYSLAGAFATTDAQCKPSTAKSAISGTVTIDSVSASAATGSFDLIFGDGSAKGKFTTSLCFTTDEFTKLGQSCSSGDAG